MNKYNNFVKTVFSKDEIELIMDMVTSRIHVLSEQPVGGRYLRAAIDIYQKFDIVEDDKKCQKSKK